MAFMTKEWRGKDHIPVERFHHVEFCVGNAKQSTHFFRSAFGFTPYAYRGPETGSPDEVAFVLRQNDIFVVLSTPLSSRHPDATLLKTHGDFVRNVAFSVKDSQKTFEKCTAAGAEAAALPEELKDDFGTLKRAAVRACGHTVHTLIDASEYRGVWAPGFIPLELPAVPTVRPGLKEIDHVVANVAEGDMDRWVRFYENVFGFMNFVEFDEHDISTQYSALKSKVVRSRNWKVKLPINEPAKGLRKSQIEEFIQFNEGPGIQHIALQTDDIIAAIRALRTNGVEFLSVPDAYYEALADRVGDVDEDVRTLQQLNILVDRDSDGYLLQLFTKPLMDRPTFFFEIIQRKGAFGFGQGNFQALFESIEREQERRGNL